MFHKFFLSKRSYFIHFWYPKYIIFNVSLKYIYFPMKYLIPRFLEPRLTVFISWFRFLKILYRNLQFVLWPLTCLKYMSLSNLPWIVHIERYWDNFHRCIEKQIFQISLLPFNHSFIGQPLKNQCKFIRLCVAVSGFYSTWLWCSEPEAPSCSGNWHELTGLSFSSISHWVEEIAQSIFITSSPPFLLLAGRIRSKIHV